MNSAIERLISLQVRDIMARDVVTIPANSTMSEAADKLRNHSVTGAPVTDELGRCIGVLSGTDFVQRNSENTDNGGNITHVLSSRHPSGMFQIEEVPNELVRAHMSPTVQTVDEHCTLVQAGRCMCHEHIHRLVVIDKRSRPVGVISSLDFVSAMISAINE